MPTPQEILQNAFTKAQSSNEVYIEQVNTIVKNAETHKAVLAALITSLTKKLEAPNQDIRQHKVELSGGYSGRVYDTSYVTPFIRQKFPRLAMKSGSGWLTRSIEQLHPFTHDFPGRIRNSEVKLAFLGILHDIEVNKANAETYLIAIFQGLIHYQQAAPSISTNRIHTTVTVASIIRALQSHFHSNYGVSGASRLPVIAVYSIYELLMNTPRYKSKALLPLKSHTTSDLKSGTIGDVEVVHKDGSFFEAVEIKHNIPITLALVEDAFEKIQTFTVSRYYLLTTAEPNTSNFEDIEKFTRHVRLQHGCEIIVNGIVPSLKYYLGLLEAPGTFLECYEKHLMTDYSISTDVKSVHVEKWKALREKIDE